METKEIVPTKRSILDRKAIKQAAEVLNALKNPVRNKIIAFIAKREAEKKPAPTVTEIYIAMRMEQSQISEHLRILKKADIVFMIKQGKFHEYYINTDRCIEIFSIVEKLAQLYPPQEA